MNTGWVAAAALSGALICTGLGYLWGQSDASLANTVKTQDSKITDLGSIIEKQAEYRQEEVRRGDVAENVSRETGSKLADVVASDAISGAVSDRLRQQLDATSKRLADTQATCDARIAQQGKAAAEEYRLLAELYRESDAAAGARAKEAEEYRIAGLACEAVYDGIRNQPEQHSQ